jgi:hypothetical protein
VGIQGGELGEHGGERPFACRARARRRTAQQPLKLGAGVLDRRQVGRGGGPVPPRAVPGRDAGAHPRALVRRQVVQHHRPARHEAWGEAPATYRANAALSAAPATVIAGPIPAVVSDALWVVVGGVLRGTQP